MDRSKLAAESFLTSLLGKNLRITTTDTRLFVGEFKCTDADRNIILSRTYEYRLPSSPPSSFKPTTTEAGAEEVGEPEKENANREESEGDKGEGADKVVLDMASRYLGLVVVPGEFITKIEVEEFASQVKDAGSMYAAVAWSSLEGEDIAVEVEVEGGGVNIREGG